MVQTIQPTQRITIHFECFDDLPNDNYVAWIEGDDYKGMVVSANSVAECVQEIGISLKVLELYRKNLKMKAVANGS